MGQVINIDTRSGGLPAPLTETGRGGFLSSGYLADRPAIEAVDDDETVEFVLTNRKRGVTIAGETTEHVTPDARYRTVAVVTDRRLIVLVGQGDGDEQFTLEISAVVGVATTRGRRSGRLTVESADGTVWHVHTDTTGVDEVAEYLRRAAEAWRDVEGLLAAVQRTLGTAAERRRTGEFESAVSAVRSTQDQLEAALTRADRFGGDRAETAIQHRVRTVESRCQTAVVATRVDAAREAATAGERHCQSGDYESAQTAYERARDAYDDALSARQTELERVERIEDERERVDRLATELRDSPLRKAITADRAAVSADDPEVVAGHWNRALAQYRRALDVGDEPNGLTGDEERIRDRIAGVAERLTAIQRTMSNDARRAGDWYSDAGQHEAAREEFERAADALEAALATAREWYPDAVTHLTAELEAVSQRVERTDATLSGDPVADRIRTDDAPDYDLEATVGDIEDPTAVEASVETAAAVGEERLPDATATRLQGIDEAAATAVVERALAETSWSVRAAPVRSPFDFLASTESERIGVVVHAPDGGSVGDERVSYCDEITGAAGTDTVMLATTGEVSEPTRELAEELGVRLLRRDSLAAIVDAGRLRAPTVGPEEGLWPPE